MWSTLCKERPTYAATSPVGKLVASVITPFAARPCVPRHENTWEQGASRSAGSGSQWNLCEALWLMGQLARTSAARGHSRTSLFLLLL